MSASWAGRGSEWFVKPSYQALCWFSIGIVWFWSRMANMCTVSTIGLHADSLRILFHGRTWAVDLVTDTADHCFVRFARLGSHQPVLQSSFLLSRDGRIFVWFSMLLKGLWDFKEPDPKATIDRRLIYYFDNVIPYPYVSCYKDTCFARVQR